MLPICFAAPNGRYSQSRHKPDLVEEDLVTDWRPVPLLGPVELVLVAELEELLSHQTLLLNRIYDILVDSGIEKVFTVPLKPTDWLSHGQLNC